MRNPIYFVYCKKVHILCTHQVSQNGLDIIGFMIDRLASDFKPYLNTVFDFHTSNIGDPFTDDRIWNAEVQRSRCLMFAFTAAVGQARLLYGNQVRLESS